MLSGIKKRRWSLQKAGSAPSTTPTMLMVPWILGLGCAPGWDTQCQLGPQHEQWTWDVAVGSAGSHVPGAGMGWEQHPCWDQLWCRSLSTLAWDGTGNVGDAAEHSPALVRATLQLCQAWLPHSQSAWRVRARCEGVALLPIISACSHSLSVPCISGRAPEQTQCWFGNCRVENYNRKANFRPGCATLCMHVLGGNWCIKTCINQKTRFNPRFFLSKSSQCLSLS